MAKSNRAQRHAPAASSMSTLPACVSSAMACALDTDDATRVLLGLVNQELANRIDKVA